MGRGRGAGLAWALCGLFAAGCGKPQLKDAEADLEVTPTSLDFGLVAVGGSSPLSLTLHNAGVAPVNVSALSAPAPFQVREFPAAGFALQSGDQQVVSVVFAPSAAGAAQGSATVTADDGAQHAISLTGQGVQLSASVSPASLAFGQVAMGNTSTLAFTVTNASALPLHASVTIDGDDAQEFTATDAATTVDVAAQSSTDVHVQFSPDHLGISEAAAHVAYCAGCTPLTVPLSGEGTASCIDVTPETADFGSVPVGQSATLSVTVTNPGTAAVDVTDVFLASSSSPDFGFSGFTAGATVTLAPAGAMPLTLTLTPSSNGPRQGALRIKVAGENGADGCWAQIKLTGSGGAGCLAVDPAAIDFGLVPTGMSGQKKIYVANTGCGADVQLDGVVVTGDTFSVSTSQPTPFVVKQGDTIELMARFNPPAPGAYQGSVHLAASVAGTGQALDQPPADVPLTGTSRGLAPCQYSVAPPRLDFGTMSVSRSASLNLRVTNTGTDDCYFSNFELTSSTSPIFSLVGASTGFVLAKGDSHDAIVTAVPTAPGSFAGAVETYVSDPANPYQSWPIAAVADVGCLSIDPEDLDFGTVFAACPPPTRTVNLSNMCAGSLTLKSVVKGPSTSTAFTLPGLPPFPVVLAPAASLALSVQFAPQGDELDSMPLFVDDGTAQRLIALAGRGVKDPWRTDAFDQIALQKADVLFVLDNSGSMADKQASVTANLSAFLKSALNQNVDYHIGVTTTGLLPAAGGWSACPGGVDGGEDGRLFPADNSSPRILTPATPDPTTVWTAMSTVGTCHWLEQGMQASYLALTPPLVDHADDPATPLPDDGNLGFYRADAKLTVIYISDEDDQSDGTVDSYLAFLRSLKPNPSQLSVSVVVTPADISTCPDGTSSGLRYIELATKLGGVVESICTPDWAASLQRIGDNTFGLTSVFPLSAVPSDSSQITVTVNGASVSSTGTWLYDGDYNAVVFWPGSTPSAGSHVEIRYPLGCN